jgi:nucleoside-diphosphate-sugar epimerase
VRVLVTGATGFLGSHVADQLAARGDKVRALVRRSSKVEHLEKLGAELAYANLEKGEGLDAALEGVDAIVHCAGVVKALDEAGFHEVNEGGTAHLVKAARRVAKQLKRFVYISSHEAWGPAEPGVMPTEEMEARPITMYGRSKLAGEKAVLAAKDELPVTVLRPTGIYGPRDTEILQLFAIANRGLMPLINSRSSRFTMVYGPDCASAVLASFDVAHESGSIYFVTDGNVYTWHEAIGIVEGAIGRRTLLRFEIPRAVVQAVAIASELSMKVTKKAQIVTREKVGILRAPNLVISSEKIRRELGWKPEMSFAEGSKKTVAWYRAEGWL